eukprot:4987554-Pyramimonas_sp.AAC.1
MASGVRGVRGDPWQVARGDRVLQEGGLVDGRMIDLRGAALRMLHPHVPVRGGQVPPAVGAGVPLRAHAGFLGGPGGGGDGSPLLGMMAGVGRGSLAVVEVLLLLEEGEVREARAAGRARQLVLVVVLLCCGVGRAR